MEDADEEDDIITGFNEDVEESFDIGGVGNEESIFEVFDKFSSSLIVEK